MQEVHDTDGESSITRQNYERAAQPSREDRRTWDLHDIQEIQESMGKVGVVSNLCC